MAAGTAGGAGGDRVWPERGVKDRPRVELGALGRFEAGVGLGVGRAQAQLAERRDRGA